MKVGEFVEEVKATLDAFKDVWDSHKGEQYWPDELPEGEWLEQFLALNNYEEPPDIVEF